VRSALLRGREHLELGQVIVQAEADAAVAISIGGAKKAYAHTDPNEDCAWYAVGDAGVMVGVADGHGGSEAAELAATRILESYAPAWTSAATTLRGRWQELALGAFAALNAAILAHGASGGRKLSRTTLAFAVARPGDRFLYYASMGDSHVYQVTGGAAYDLACELSRTGDPYFLGSGPETLEALREKTVIGAESIGATRAVIAVTDGLSERTVGVDDPDEAVADAAAAAVDAAETERPGALARGLLETALAAHVRNPSGDNIATAVAWLDAFVPGAPASGRP
jgi:hypothetical protein